MIGPWKRVAELEGERIGHLSRIAFLEGQCADAHQTVLDLTAKIVDLKREGFNPPAERYVEAPRGPDIPDVILNEMVEQAEPGTAVWTGIEREVRKLQALGLAPEMIAERVSAGTEFNWED